MGGSGPRSKSTAQAGGKSSLAEVKHVAEARRNHSQADSSQAIWPRNS